eukprot:CAMPEP_0172849442 /NCGR_PEP_ID=MMETSP1075-20121228/46440_1 /TAXON_ID=2916 /ORGANISM="Ceratium fusus, Strain PA161109" /LENGTH=37 /DNA_ID= /DNA_START= /DNA_END= /DNA_ORIENTATION=
MTDQHGPEAKRGRVQQPGPNEIWAIRPPHSAGASKRP